MTASGSDAIQNSWPKSKRRKSRIIRIDPWRPRKSAVSVNEHDKTTRFYKNRHAEWRRIGDRMQSPSTVSCIRRLQLNPVRTGGEDHRRVAGSDEIRRPDGASDR